MPNKEEVVSFSMTIEELVEEKNIPYMDAIILHCENVQMEIEVGAKLLSGAIKAKLKSEAEELNFLPRSNTLKLPL
tara:strand:- start:77221 stop:77448 length:228 start_codon:yes stop_codon:yes gene_type:complete